MLVETVVRNCFSRQACLLCSYSRARATGIQIGFLENTDAKIKKRSPSNLALLKESLKGNLSPSEATAQLKVLCRKFAALTEKVKVGRRMGASLKTVLLTQLCTQEETKIREEAEKEVRRLKAIIDGCLHCPMDEISEAFRLTTPGVAQPMQRLRCPPAARIRKRTCESSSSRRRS